MVKFGRKFFFDNKHSKKTRIITIAVIGVLVIGLILFFTTTRFFKSKGSTKPEEKIIIRNELEVEVNSIMPEKTSYFEKLENFDVDKILISYPENLPLENSLDNCTQEQIDVITNIETNNTPIEEGSDPYACVTKIPYAIGNYDITINFNGKDYIVLLKVVDTIAPQVTLKEVQITEGDTYKINDFIESCSDNGKGECSYDYYYEDYENEKINFGNHTAPGTYDIVIVSLDNSGNISLPVNTKLTILPKPEVKTYTITFNSNGGSNVESQNVIENDKAYQPSNPTKAGYTFGGWYLGNNKYNFNTSVTSNITLTAKWTKNQSNNKPTTCKYGSLEYDSKAYPIITMFITDKNCAISENEAQLSKYTDANKIIQLQYAEGEKLENWINKSAHIGLHGSVKPYGVYNKSGKGIVGYVLEGIVTQTVNGTTTKVARYYLDQNGKRIFKLNTIEIPEN
ncbi:MAG: InlB B-repeat-containing protein [Bacilli bacterium]|nr:InlB B-repeat-containing protein [Bacilli bacterium]